MKRKLLKSLLLSILAMFAAGAWADNVNATLEHTAGGGWGSAQGNAPTVDSEKEYYNNDLESGWAGCAYAKFSFTLPDGHTITKATLTYSKLQYNAKTYTEQIFYMKKGFDLDWATYTTQANTDMRNTANRVSDAILTTAAHQGAKNTGKEHKNLTADVTSAVKAIADEGQSYILFQWTANGGSAHLYGKANADAPTLVIETASAASQTKYTVNFTDGTNTLKDAKVYDGLIGDKVAASADDLGKFVVGDKKYAYQSGNDSIVLVKEEASNVLTLVFAELPKYEYAVVSSLGDTLKTASDFKDEDITYYYPGFALKDTTFYTAPKNSSNPYYGGSFKLDQDKKSVTVTYTKSESIKNVVYFSEAENIEGATPKTTNNATIRCSNGTGAVFADTTKFVTLNPGVYKIFGQVWGTAGLTASVTDAAKKVLWSLASTGSLVNSTSDEFTLNKAADLFVSTAGGNDNRMLDLIYIVKTSDVVVDSVTTDTTVVDVIVADTVVFNFADSTFRENVGEAMTDVKGYIYNETFTVDSVSLQITAGSAPSRIYKDANRGQCLVTYKEYTTLTFRAPEGKAITQIDFTAAGNSNINNFTASSDSIKGMTWIGNADGVRFAQGGTSYLANAIVTLIDKNAETKTLPEIEYTDCANIAAFNALEAGTYAKVTLTDAEVIGKSADDYSTVWLQDATGGCWIQYTSLNDSLKESTKVNGTVYVVKRLTSGNPQMKEAEGTLKSELNATVINEYTIVKGDSIKQINVAANLNKVVKIVADSLKMTSATAGTLYVGPESIALSNGSETANQQLHKIADWKKDSVLMNVEVTAILVASSATATQLLPIAIEQHVISEADTVTFNFADSTFREHIGTAMTDVNGYIYNETFTVDSVSLQITAGSAPSRIYKDANRGQCLVTYKEYTTLTFRAPEGKAITQIDFTAAGNSNINNFTASSDSIKGMTWIGNADGVRFAQGGTSYLANAIVTLVDKNDSTKTLPEIEYTKCANIAAFNALEAGTYAKVTLTDAEVIGKSADGYSTVWLQDATGGCWIQYTSLNDTLKESTKVNGTVYVVKRATSGNPQMKEAEGTLKSELNAAAISEYTIVMADSIKQMNVAENLNKMVKIAADSLVMTSATAGELYVGGEAIDVTNGAATANQNLCKIAGWKKDSVLVNVEVTAILSAKSATANQLLPVAIKQLADPVVDGIRNFSAAGKNVTIFNLQGVRQDRAKKGLNIIGGKKVVIK